MILSTPKLSLLRAVAVALVFAPDSGSAEALRISGRVIHVGPTRSITSIHDAARDVHEGETIEVDSGVYRGDVAVFDKSGVTIRSVGGVAHLMADGANAEGKAIWVVRANLTVQGFTFSGARVPDGNGAGIRHERGRLRILQCAFTDNEDGLLSGNDPDAELDIEQSEFGRNGVGDGYTHNLYVGAIRSLHVTESYFHHGRSGQLLKSRARENRIFYNRLTDEAGGTASYELEFPNGGVAYVIGNIIQQSARTENRIIVSFGAEGYKGSRNELYLVNNTLVDDLSLGGRFVRIYGGVDQVKIINNVLVGNGTLDWSIADDQVGNVRAPRRDLASPIEYDYRLKTISKLVGTARDPGDANGRRLRPTREYVHPMSSRPVPAVPYSPGALQISSQ